MVSRVGLKLAVIWWRDKAESKFCGLMSEGDSIFTNWVSLKIYHSLGNLIALYAIFIDIDASGAV